MSKLIVVSGPSGCGKTTIARAVLRGHPELTFSVSATTRMKRPSEIDGRDYFFLTEDLFQEKIQRNELIEWEQIYGDYYGSLKSEIDRAFDAEHSILLDVDVNGALSIKKKYPRDSVLIFIKPPSMKILTDRLLNRKTETKETIAKRLDRVSMELDKAGEFDFAIINDDLHRAVAEVDLIITRTVSSPA